MAAVDMEIRTGIPMGTGMWTVLNFHWVCLSYFFHTSHSCHYCTIHTVLQIYTQAYMTKTAKLCIYCNEKKQSAAYSYSLCIEDCGGSVYTGSEDSMGIPIGFPWVWDGCAD